MNQSYRSCAKNQSNGDTIQNLMMHRGPIIWDSAGSYMYLCMVSSEDSTSSMKDQLYGNSEKVSKGILVQRICATIHRELVHQISGMACTNMHNSSLKNGIECMCMSQCLSMCVPSLPDRLIAYHMHVQCITIWYVQVYRVLECVKICHYNYVQVHVCSQV